MSLSPGKERADTIRPMIVIKTNSFAKLDKKCAYWAAGEDL